MDGRSFGVIFTYFLALLLHDKKEDDSKTTQTEVKQLEKVPQMQTQIQQTSLPIPQVNLHSSQLKKNSSMYHLKDGLSPNSVLSVIGGSLSLHTLIILVIFLQVQSCAAALKGDEVNSTEYLKNYMTPTGDMQNSSDWLSVKDDTAPTGGKMNSSDRPSFTNETAPTGNDVNSSDCTPFKNNTTLTGPTDADSDSADFSPRFPNESTFFPTEEGDDWAPIDRPNLKTDTTLKDDFLKFFCTPVGHVCIAVFSGLVLCFLYVCWRKCRTGATKSKSEEDPPPPSVETYGSTKSRSTQDPLLHSVEDETQGAKESTSAAHPSPPSTESMTQGATKSKLEENPPQPSAEEKTQALVNHSANEENQSIRFSLEEQRTDTESLRDDLKSQLQKVRQEQDENKEELESVENKLKNETADKKQELLSEKENLLNSKWKLDEMETEKNKLLLQAERLLKTIDTVTNKMSGQSSV